MKIEELLQMTAERGASDLILTVGCPPVLRIDKELVFTQLESLAVQQIEELIQPLLNEEIKEELKKISEMSFIYALAGWGRFRITVFKQRGSTAVTIRRFSYQLPSFADLNLPEAPLKLFCALKGGLVLITGPAGNGKSTTLAAMIRMLNEQYAYHIVTLEDPIEYLFKHGKSVIEQRAIPYDTPSFSTGLKEVLRQTPDVVVVGEIRDPETMRLTLRIAESGILVLSTFHTPSATETVSRMLNFFPGEEEQVRRQLSLVLKGVFCQQLIPLYHRKGIAPAWEVLLINEKVTTLIREGNIHQIDNVIETSSKAGMQTMDESLVSLYQRKLINSKELLLRIRDKERDEVKNLSPEEEFTKEESF